MKLSWQQITLPVLACGLLAVGAPQLAHAQAAIKIDGSSTVFPISEAYAEEFQIQKRGKVRVTVRRLGHRRRLQEVHAGRDRHLRSLAPDQEGGDR